MFAPLLPLSALAIACAMAIGQPVQATTGGRPFFDCTSRTLGAGLRWCRDVRTLRNAWFVYPPYGSYHLHDGKFRNPSQLLTVRLLERPGLIAIDRDHAAAFTAVTRGVSGASMYLSFFSRLGPWFVNDATLNLGTVRPLSVTLHADRLRVSVIERNGRQSILIYHIAGRRLKAAATRHAQ